MAITPNEATDKLIKEGGQPLEDALKADIAAAEGSAEGSQEEPEKKADPEPESEDEFEDKEGDAEGDKKPEEEPDKSKEEAEGSDDAEHPSGKPKSKVGKKIEKLLSQRNSARIEAEQAKARAKAAEEELARRKKAGEGEEEDSKEDDGLIEKLLDKKLAELDARKETSRKISDADKREREALFSTFHDAKDYVEEITEILKVHPSLTDEQAYRLANPSDFVKSKEDARKKESGGRTPQRLRNDRPDLKKLSTKELDDLVKKGVADGTIVP